MIRKEVSVFGSTGFIGSHFIRKSKFETICIPRNQRYPESDEIVFLIGTVDHYNVFNDVLQDVESNIRPLIEMLEQTRLRRPNAVINYVSTWFVYGKNEIPFNESTVCNPRSFYSITKFAAELLLRSYCETFSMNYRIIRPGNIIGPGDKKASMKKNAVQHLANRVLANEDIELYEGGDIIRDFLHVDDFVKGLDIVIEKGSFGEIYNLASGNGIKIGDLLTRFRDLVGSTSCFKKIETPGFHNRVQTRDAVLDIAKLKKLGFLVSRPVSEIDLLK
jgi:nucleoside-diphosphate-sugar epimerase